MSEVKIQINSLEALERLIGGEEELELELRGSIVQEFAKRYLKGVADDVIINNATHEIRKYVQDNFINKVYSISRGYTLNPAFNETIQKSIQLHFSALINQLIREYMESDDTIKMIYKRLDDKVLAAAIRIEEELSDILLNKRIDDLVNKRLKEKLGV